MQQAHREGNKGMVGLRERKKELLIKIGDCLDYCTEIECESKRAHLGNKIDDSCFSCLNYRKMQKLRSELEDDKEKPVSRLKINRAGIKRSFWIEQREERIKIIHREAKKNTPVARVRGILEMNPGAFTNLMKNHFKMSYTELVKKYEWGEMDELEQSK